MTILSLINLNQIKAQNSELKYPEEKYFKNIRQITFSGENAEAYWSFDDSKLVDSNLFKNKMYYNFEELRNGSCWRHMREFI